jgi:hypothetical protein
MIQMTIVSSVVRSKKKNESPIDRVDPARKKSPDENEILRNSREILESSILGKVYAQT